MSTGGCGWSTAYDARLQENGKLSLSYFANVKQRTSEDWEGVEMSLSTNSIAAVALPPELKKVAIALVDKVQKAEDKAKVQRPRTSRGFDNAAPSESARPEAETRS
ncbi:MAG: DUF4139 domain-containing protein [Planctomycetota bacterium]|nr:DUF4139 domain-containing protein [Planctomycetota bacterium]